MPPSTVVPSPPVPTSPTATAPPLPQPTAGTGSTSQTLVLTVPSDVLHRLSPEPTGFTQPWATVVAALIALTAAVVAFVGVRVTIKAAAAEAQRTRRADAARARKDRRVHAAVARESNAAEDRRARQTERIKLLAETVGKSLDFQHTATVTNRRNRLGVELENLPDQYFDK